MWNDFKAFIMRGNVMDLAVGVIIGAAFGKIVASLVSDILMPPLGMLIGQVDFSDLVLTLKPASGTAKAVTINYGIFLNNVIGFLLLAFSVFLLIEFLNRLKRKRPTPAPATSEKTCPECSMTIPITAKRCGHCTTAIA